MFRVCKIQEDKQLVTGEVYAPNVVDSHGEMMLPEDVEKLAHRFIQLANLGQTIDIKHNNVPVDAYPVESFIARKGDPDFTEGAWVMSVKINDADLWAEVKAGTYNGFSWQALVYKQPALVEMVVYPESIGKTEEMNGHSHLFVAELDADGKIIGGRTSTDAGHSHAIKYGTATEVSEGHSHRFFF